MVTKLKQWLTSGQNLVPREMYTIMQIHVSAGTPKEYAQPRHYMTSTSTAGAAAAYHEPLACNSPDM